MMVFGIVVSDLIIPRISILLIISLLANLVPSPYKSSSLTASCMPWLFQREYTVTHNVLLIMVAIRYFLLGLPIFRWFRILRTIGVLADIVPRTFGRIDTVTDMVTQNVLFGMMVVGYLVLGSPVLLWIGILWIISLLAESVARAFGRIETDTKKVLLGIIIVGTVVTAGIIGSLAGSPTSLEGCSHLHREAFAQAGALAGLDEHRNLERDTDMTNCPSAANGDYRPCLRNNLNHSQNEGRQSYDTTDTMMFFWERRPRLLESRPRSSVFNLLTSDKPSFNVSRLSPTQREGLALWSKCTYPPFGQTLTQPLNLSCPFQAFNLLFFHNTLSDGQMFHPTESINPDPPPKHIDGDLLNALLVSIPQEDVVDRFFPRRILHIGATPLLKMTPLEIEHTPHNLAKMLSPLLHEMLHVTHYIYTCPICYSDACARLHYRDFGGLRHARMWLPLTVAIDLMLAKEGVLNIPGVNWKEHRLDLHADRVAAAMKNKRVVLPMQSELNGDELGGELSRDNVNFIETFNQYVIGKIDDGTLEPGFPSWRPDSAPYVVA